MDGGYQQCTSTTAARMGQFGGTFTIGLEANARISALANTARTQNVSPQTSGDEILVLFYAMALACQISNLINPLTGASIFAAGFASQWYCWRNGERVSHAFAPNNQAPFMYRPTFMDPSSEHMILNFPKGR